MTGTVTELLETELWSGTITASIEPFAKGIVPSLLLADGINILVVFSRSTLVGPLELRLAFQEMSDHLSSCKESPVHFLEATLISNVFVGKNCMKL